MPTDLKISELDFATGVTDSDYFTGIRDDGSSVYSNYNYSPSQLLTYLLTKLKKSITLVATSVSLTDVFFSNNISAIAMNGQYYILGVDFTQAGTTITLINGGSFVNGGQLIAFL